MIPADQLSVTDEKYLHHGIPVIRCKRDDVFILTVGMRDLLFLRDLAHTA